MLVKGSTIFEEKNDINKNHSAMGDGKKTNSSITLPSDMETNILLRLPSKDVIPYQCVSKSWNEEINSQDFNNQYVKKNQSNNSIIMLNFNRQSMSRGVASFDFCFPEKLKQPTLYPSLNFDPSHWMPINMVGSCNGLFCFYHGCSNTEFWVYNPVTRDVRHIIRDHLTNCWLFFFGVNNCWLRSVGFGYDAMNND